MSTLVQQQPGESPAAACRRNHWHVGTHLAGDEGHGETVIAITAVGEDVILARPVLHRGVAAQWRRVPKP